METSTSKLDAIAPATALPKYGKRAWLPLAVTAALIAVTFAFSPNFHWSAERDTPYAGDFLQEWIGGHILLSGSSSRLYEPGYADAVQHDAEVIGHHWSESKYFPMVYPPYYYALMTPLASLPLWCAAWIWATLLGVAFLLTLWGLQRWLLPQRESSHAKWLWLLPLVTLAPPVIESLTSGQKGTLLLAVFTGCFWLLSRRCDLLAGMVFGLVACKPQLGIVVALATLMAARWRFAGGVAITTVTLLLLGSCFGVSLYQDYVQLALQSGDYLETSGYVLTKSHSLLAGCKQLLGTNSHWVSIAWAIASVTVVFATACLVRRRGLVESAGELLVATILLSPHLYTYDLSLLVLPVFISANAIATGKARGKKPLFLQPFAAYLFILMGSTLLVHVGSGLGVPLLSMLLWMALISEAIREIALPNQLATTRQRFANELS